MNPQIPTVGLPHKSHKSLILNAVLALALVAAVIFAVSAMSQATTTKNSTNRKIAVAVAAAQKAEDAKVGLQFINQIQQPYKYFAGPTAYGSVTFNYPKSYSAYVDETSTSEPINGYFYPDIVPGLTSNTAFALRVELVTQPYSKILDSFSSSIKKGVLTASAYTPPRMVGTQDVQPGSRLVGMIGNKQTGDMVLVPIRTNTLKIYIESTEYSSDFDNVILPSLTFVP